VLTRTWAVPEQQPMTAVCARLEEVIRRHAPWFVSISSLTEHTRAIGWALPDTVQGAEDRCPPEWQSALARAMLAEHLSVRHIPTLLDRLLDLDPRPPAPGVVRLREGPTPVQQAGSVGRLPPPAVAVSLLRQRKYEGTVRMQDNDPRLQRHELDALVEERLSQLLSSPDHDEAAEVLETVAAEIRRWHPSFPTVPLVVQAREIRSWLHDWLQPEFPDLRIYAAQEIPPGIAATALPGP